NSCTTPSPTPTLSASRPSFAAPTSSPSASWICGGSGLSGASRVVTTSGADTFFMAVPPVLSDLVCAPNAPQWSGQGGRTAVQSSTRVRTTSARVTLAALLLLQQSNTLAVHAGPHR